ncbi:NAD-P-binding protein [Pisolithus tinctorius]|nr:NAD-P-binding protein [Pisolithus tinctorius]
MSVFNSSHLLRKSVLVTGASSGIGMATAVLFAKVDALQKVVERCVAVHKEAGAQYGSKFVTIPFDVSNKNQIASFSDKIPAELRHIDILVNNTGYVIGVDCVGDISLENMEGMFATNMFGLITLTQLFIKERGTGHIINIGSIAGKEPYAGGSIYCTTKHALHVFTAALVSEVVNTPIRVTEIQPGMVKAEFSIIRCRGNKTAADKVYNGLQPLVAEDIAEEIVWAASRPPHVNIAELFVLPINQASATITYRSKA